MNLLTLRNREHVINDLAPYLCILEHCREPQQLFLTSRDWIYHMQRHHIPVEWSCLAHTSSTSANGREEVVFQDEQAYKQHLREEHSSAKSVTEVELQIQVFAICPFCSLLLEDLEDPGVAQRALQKHVGEHLQALALCCLPCEDADEGTALSSNRAQQENNDHFARRSMDTGSTSEMSTMSDIVFPDSLIQPAATDHDSPKYLRSSRRLASSVPRNIVDATMYSGAGVWGMMKNERPPYWKGIIADVGLENDPNMAPFIERFQDHLDEQQQSMHLNQKQQTLRMTGLPQLTQTEDVESFFHERIPSKGRQIIESIGPISRTAMSQTMQTTVSFSSHEAAREALKLQHANRQLTLIKEGAEDLKIEIDHTFKDMTTLHTSANPKTGFPDIE